uniref:UBC core domain-containing protein n=1 Tax=Ascaris lumbricoides TaxID=6252 RepID=A0A0M3ISX8_ASCLU
MDFGMNSQSALLLKKQLSDLKKEPVEGFSAGLQGDGSDIYKWQVLILGPPDTPYEGGFFKANLDFPKDYPQRPPKMRFTSEIWHPNMISMLADPNRDSPANVDAAKMMRDDYTAFKKKVAACVRKSQEE